MRLGSCVPAMHDGWFDGSVSAAIDASISTCGVPNADGVTSWLLRTRSEARSRASVAGKTNVRKVSDSSRAVLSLDSPGFDDACNRIAVQFDNIGRARMYDEFRRIRATKCHEG